MCISLKEINVSNFNTTNVIGYGEMFKDCISLQELNLVSFSSNKVPLGKCIEGKNKYFRCCTGFESMFKNCKNLKSIYVNSTWDISNKPNEEIFTNCGTNILTKI